MRREIKLKINASNSKSSTGRTTVLTIVKKIKYNHIWVEKDMWEIFFEL